MQHPTRHPFAAVPLALLLLMPAAVPSRGQEAGPWPAQKANAWSRDKAWLVGCNFTPASAINELEMWQADTFDSAALDRELGWAKQLGFNSVRVFLHDLPYRQDAKGFLQRIDRFLEIADRHGVGAVFVLFDSCWDPFPKAGKQHDPKPGLHNSGWVQCPGLELLKDAARHGELEGYVKGVVGRFKDDKRVHAWDVYNEPDNANNSSYGRDNLKQEPPDKVELSLALLKKAFAWARAAGPSQPLTSGVWIGDWPDPAKLSATERVQLENSDVISFHNYGPLDGVRKAVEHLKRYDRPILCTEYMARPAGSRFDPILAYFKEQKVGAYNWGFVSGKTQTIYPWDSWQKPYAAEPPVWFHDILRPDGTAYDAKEVQYINGVTGKSEGAKP